MIVNACKIRHRFKIIFGKYINKVEK